MARPTAGDGRELRTASTDRRSVIVDVVPVARFRRASMLRSIRSRRGPSLETRTAHSTACNPFGFRTLLMWTSQNSSAIRVFGTRFGFVLRHDYALAAQTGRRRVGRSRASVRGAELIETLFTTRDYVFGSFRTPPPTVAGHMKDTGSAVRAADHIEQNITYVRGWPLIVEKDQLHTAPSGFVPASDLDRIAGVLAD